MGSILAKLEGEGGRGGGRVHAHMRYSEAELSGSDARTCPMIEAISFELRRGRSGPATP